MPRKRLPRGLWWDCKQKCFRVRLYRNNVPYYAGKFKQYSDAFAAWQRLRIHLRSIPILAPGQLHVQTLQQSDINGLLTMINAKAPLL